MFQIFLNQGSVAYVIKKGVPGNAVGGKLIVEVQFFVSGHGGAVIPGGGEIIKLDESPAKAMDIGVYIGSAVQVFLIAVHIKISGKDRGLKDSPFLGDFL